MTVDVVSGGTGHHVIAGERVEAAGASTYHAHDPRSGRQLSPAYSDADEALVERALTEAAASANGLAEDAQTRARLLAQMAERLDGDAEDIVMIADQETALGRDRLAGELQRTTRQLRLFVEVLEYGAYLDVIVDRADPSAGRPDLRRSVVPLGPVVVFSAGNFPLAFSVAGGDTASALAAGCPVVVKGHPDHPATSERVADHIRDAVEDLGLRRGAFSLLHAAGHKTGRRLVEHPMTRAVAFTGSTSGGTALQAIAAGREEPIPVFAEMGSINPVVVLASTAQARPRQAGESLAGSIVLSAGQFCTKPGIVFVPEGKGGDELVDALTTSIAGWDAAPLLAERIQTSLAMRMRQTTEDLEEDSPPAGSGDGYRQPAAIFETAVAELLEHPRLLGEMFGPAAIVVRYGDVSELTPVWNLIGGSLTATLLLEDSDEDGARRLVTELTRLAGRVIFNGVPTGVAVTHAMHHGGPFPATTDSAHTSVGATAIRRFLRPVVYQDCPPSLLPAHLRDENLVGIPRTVDGQVLSAGSES